MLQSRRRAADRGQAFKRAVVGGLIAISASWLQACSASRDPTDGSARLGSDPSTVRMAAPPREEWRQPSSFDRDGPSDARPVYRGGRDPVSGRAQQDGQQSWPPAAPPHMQSAAVQPLPPPPPSSGYYQPGYQPSYQPAITHPGQQAPQAQYPDQAAARTTSVEVRPGDTLYRIARANSVTVPALMQANGLASESIKVGQRLSIPGR